MARLRLESGFLDRSAMPSLAHHGHYVVIDLIEDQADGNGGHHRREKVSHPPEAVQLQLLVQQDSQQRGQCRHQKGHHDRIPEGASNRRHGQLILKSAEIVLQPDKLISRADAVPVRQRIINAADNGERKKDQIQQNRRHRKKEIGRPFHAFSEVHRSSPLQRLSVKGKRRKGALPALFPVRY